MATYDNPRTGVVHWLPRKRPWPARTACNHFAEFITTWNWSNVDSAGVPADVTCCKCKETAEFLDAREQEHARLQKSIIHVHQSLYASQQLTARRAKAAGGA